MYKPQALRNHIIRHVPALARDPDKLSLFIKDGRLASSGTQSLSFEYAYTLELTVLDYADHPDTVFVPVLQWLKVNQRELFDNPDTSGRAVKFEAEYLNHSAIDLLLTLDLTERVLSRPPAKAGGPMTLHHAPEPGAVGSTTQDSGWTGGMTGKKEHWELWVLEQKLGEWDFRPTSI